MKTKSFGKYFLAALVALLCALGSFAAAAVFADDVVTQPARFTGFYGAPSPSGDLLFFQGRFDCGVGYDEDIAPGTMNYDYIRINDKKIDEVDESGMTVQLLTTPGVIHIQEPAAAAVAVLRDGMKVTFLAGFSPKEGYALAADVTLTLQNNAWVRDDLTVLNSGYQAGLEGFYYINLNFSEQVTLDGNIKGTANEDKVRFNGEFLSEYDEAAEFNAVFVSNANTLQLQKFGTNYAAGDTLTFLPGFYVSENAVLSREVSFVYDGMTLWQRLPGVSITFTPGIAEEGSGQFAYSNFSLSGPCWNGLSVRDSISAEYVKVNDKLLSDPSLADLDMQFISDGTNYVLQLQDRSADRSILVSGVKVEFLPGFSIAYNSYMEEGCVYYYEDTSRGWSTPEQIAAYRAELAGSLNEYLAAKDEDDYPAANWQQLQQLAAEGEEAVAAARTMTEADAAVASYKQQMDAVSVKVAATVEENPVAEQLTYGATLSESDLSGGRANVEGTFAWEDGEIVPTVSNAGYAVVFTPASSDYLPAKITVNITVVKAAPTVSVNPTAEAIIYGDTLSESDLTGGTASVGGVFTWKDPETVPTVQNEGYTAVFMPDDSSNYQSVEVTVGLTVNKAVAPQITFPVAGAITYGQKLSESLLTGGSDFGTFAWKDPDTVPAVAQSGQGFAMTFMPADTQNYDWDSEALMQNVIVTVKKATPATPETPVIADAYYEAGATLAEISLPEGFVWQDPDTDIAAGANSYFAIYSFDDSGNYETLTVAITVVNLGEPEQSGGEENPGEENPGGCAGSAGTAVAFTGAIAAAAAAVLALKKKTR